MISLRKLSTQIYNTKSLKESRRAVVFVARALLHKDKIQALADFFTESSFKRDVIAAQPCFLEQATRQFFYKGSTFNERYALIRAHWESCAATFKETSLRSMYLKDGLTLCRETTDELLSFQLKFETGQKKEGLLSLILNYGNQHLYQIIFWLSPDKTGAKSLWIGALQGSNAVDAPAIIKKVTKQFFAYRTKNLILYGARSVAQQIACEKIYAVSNKGYYANNHLRLDRKLKTSLDDFWAETGGTLTDDDRFYELPLVEYRKTLDEVKTHKRNLYRKRFAILDEVALAIKTNLAAAMLKMNGGKELTNGAGQTSHIF